MEFLIGVNDGEFLFDNATQDTWRTDAMYTALDVAGNLAARPYEFGYKAEEIDKLDIEKRDENGETVWVRTVYTREDEE